MAGSSDEQQQPRTVPRNKRTITAEATGAAAVTAAGAKDGAKDGAKAGANSSRSRSAAEATTDNSATIRNKSAREYKGKARARTYASKAGRPILKGGRPYAQIHLPSRVYTEKNPRPDFSRVKCKLGRFCKSHWRWTGKVRNVVQNRVTYTICTESLLIWAVLRHIETKNEEKWDDQLRF